MANTIWIKAIIIAICTGIFYYGIRRLFSIFHINLPKGTIILIAICLAIFTAVFIAVISISSITYSGSSNKFLDILGTIATRLLTLGVILFTLLLIENIISIRYKPNPRITTGIIIIILCLGIFFSLKTKITTYEINTDKINKDTKILLVSDFHVDHIYKDFHVKKIQKMIESEKPDIVLIAGDLMNKANKGYIKYFNSIEPEKTKPVPYYNPQQYNPPIFAVMGNHDVMGDKNVIKEIGKNSNIRLLDNEAIINLNGTTTGCGSAADYHFEKEIPDLTCPGTIRIIGLRDKSLWGDENIDSIMQDILTPKLPIKKDCTDYKYDGFTILMTHQPISLEKLKDYPIDLEVAGHTHRGQVFGLRKVVEIVNDYGYGKFEENGKTAIITQGIGTRGLPFRFGTQSEMVIINLKKKN